MLQALRSSLSVVSLVIANTIPLFGVLFFGWDIFTLFLLYWLESAAIGFFNVLKFIKIKGRFKVFLIPFFIFHFGAFMFGHLMFIVTLFGPGGGDFSFFPAQAFLSALYEIWPAVGTLFISHGISFVTNFLGKQEYLKATGEQVMNAPYPRIVLMHVTIIFGGFLTQLFDAPVFALAFLTILKTVVDLLAHLKAHAKLAESTAKT